MFLPAAIIMLLLPWILQLTRDCFSFAVFERTQSITQSLASCEEPDARRIKCVCVCGGGGYSLNFCTSPQLLYAQSRALHRAGDCRKGPKQGIVGFCLRNGCCCFTPKSFGSSPYQQLNPQIIPVLALVNKHRWLALEHRSKRGGARLIFSRVGIVLPFPPPHSWYPPPPHPSALGFRFCIAWHCSPLPEKNGLYKKCIVLSETVYLGLITVTVFGVVLRALSMHTRTALYHCTQHSLSVTQFLGRGCSSVVEPAASWSEGCGFDPRQERRGIFLFLFCCCCNV